MNAAKVTLIIIVVGLVIVIFFALTGLEVDLNRPVVTVERAAAKFSSFMGRLNRAINNMLREFINSIRFSMPRGFR
jgi:hypothetical protein